MAGTFNGSIPSGQPDIPGIGSSVPGTPSTVPNYGEVRAPNSLQLRDMQGRYVKNGFGWEWQNLQQLMNMPESFGQELLDGVNHNLQELTKVIQDYAQANAPWEDHTGDARAKLKAVFIQRRDVFEIDLGHGVSYGYYLENSNGGVFAIIQPTLRHFAPYMADIVIEARSGTIPGAFE